MGPPLNLIIPFRCLTSSESEVGPWECSGGLYNPERSMEILADEEGVMGESSKCSTKLLSEVCECEEEEEVEVEHW